jgi:hypothetical protein
VRGGRRKCQGSGAVRKALKARRRPFLPSFFSIPFVLFFASCTLHCSNRRLIVRSSSDRYQHLFNHLGRAISPQLGWLERKDKDFEHDACEIVLLFDDADRRSKWQRSGHSHESQEKGIDASVRGWKGNEKGPSCAARKRSCWLSS